MNKSKAMRDRLNKSDYKDVDMPKVDTLRQHIKEGDIGQVLSNADRRSAAAKNEDWNKEASKTLDPRRLSNIDKWAKDPAHTDLKGVDSQSEIYSADKSQGYSGRASASKEVSKVMDSDLWDVAEYDNSLNSKEQSDITKRKIAPNFRDIQ